MIESQKITAEEIHKELYQASKQHEENMRELLSIVRNSSDPHTIDFMVGHAGEFEDLLAEYGFLPSTRFIGVEAVTNVCKKYGLVCGDSEFFTAPMPVTNAQELENFARAWKAQLKAINDADQEIILEDGTVVRALGEEQKLEILDELFTEVEEIVFSALFEEDDVAKYTRENHRDLSALSIKEQKVIMEFSALWAHCKQEDLNVEPLLLGANRDDALGIVQDAFQAGFLAPKLHVIGEPEMFSGLEEAGMAIDEATLRIMPEAKTTQKIEAEMAAALERERIREEERKKREAEEAERRRRMREEDPVVLAQVPGGFLIVTAWGEVASDEKIVRGGLN